MLIAIRKEPKTMHKTSPVEPGKVTQRTPVAIVKIAIKMLSHLTFLKKLFIHYPKPELKCFLHDQLQG